jgi:hypothetical protein
LPSSETRGSSKRRTNERWVSLTSKVAPFLRNGFSRPENSSAKRRLFFFFFFFFFVVVVVVVSGSRGMFEELVRVAGRGVGKKFTITVVDAVTVVGDVDAWTLIQALIPPVEGGD